MGPSGQFSVAGILGRLEDHGSGEECCKKAEVVVSHQDDGT